jgi:phage terminase large subunit
LLTAKEEIEFIELLQAETEEKEERERLNKQTNDCYITLYENKSRYLILYGGAGSGKSVFVGQKIVNKLKSKKGINYLILRNTANSNRISTFPLIKQTINGIGLMADFKINESDMRIKHIPTGNEIVFAGLDNVEKVKSVTFSNGNLTDVWMEESSEIEKPDFEQIDLRLRGKVLLNGEWVEPEYQIVITYNPTSIVLWQKDFIEEYVKDSIQIGTIYNGSKTMWDEDEQKEITTYLTVLRTTYKNNKFIDANYKQKLESYKDKDPYFYTVYCIGEYGVTGKTVFDAQKLTERLLEVKEHKLISGRFEEKEGNPRWEPDVNGPWIIFKHPEPKHYYVFGSDVAEGIDGDDSQKEGDYSSTQCLDNSTLEQCAVYHDHIDPDRYADELYIAGMYFNIALIVPEINMESGVQRNLERKKYPKLYLREQQDDIVHGVQMKYGWRTTETTRRLMVADTIEYVRDHTNLINDPYTIDEMLTFIRNKNGRPEAQSGKHDDRVMAYGIAIQAALSGQQQKYFDIYNPNLKGIPEDALEDYYRASEQGKKHLLQQWGRDQETVGKQDDLTIIKKDGKRVYV